jgi:N-acetylmuramoyl-L-alanine amidase
VTATLKEEGRMKKRWVSPNFDARNPRVPLSFIVLHYTDMPDAEVALTRLCDPETRVSAHDLIDEEGRLYALVPPEKRAWHAGASFWRGTRDMNSASIGIELVNPGHSCGYRSFPKAQIDALLARLAQQCAAFGLSRRAVLGHADIAPGRRKDPGELFPWDRLAAEGFGLWPANGAADRSSGLGSDEEVRRLLSAIGYETETTPLAEVLLAFQRHFVPQRLSGQADPETLAALCALAREAQTREAKAYDKG